MHKLYTRMPMIFMAAVYVSTAFAEEEEAVEKAECLAAPDMLPKLALYGVPLFVLVAAGFAFSKMWGEDAANKGIPPSSHIIAGWMLGLFLSALSFSGMLYATSSQMDTEGDVMSTASCYPDGWGIIAGILVAVTLVVFIVSKMNAKK